jgi:hypothetical protein
MYDAVDVRAIEEEVIKHHRDLFPRLPGKKWYRTRGFKELAYVHGTPHQSYRKTSRWLNRVRHQPGATSARTLQDSTEAEGERLREHIYQKADGILQQREVTPQGKPLNQGTNHRFEENLCFKPEEVESAYLNLEIPREWQLAMKENPIAYENPAHSVNISLDDVGVKKQKEERQSLDKRERENQEKQRKSAYQTVVHVENQRGSYVFNALGIGIALQILLAFLLHNDLLKGKLIVFLDGQRSLHSSVGKALSGWAPIQLILDWYHLVEKCKKQLSLALNNRQKRNEVLQKLLNWLWHGLIEPATDYLKTIEDVHIKNPEALEKLRGYFERNRSFIPCYSVRKRLGLRNSSNVGEKSNDLLVSDRQKHNGMSWSQKGSASLAAITALVRNQEYYRWFTTEQINFKLVPYPESTT